MSVMGLSLGLGLVVVRKQGEGGRAVVSGREKTSHLGGVCVKFQIENSLKLYLKLPVMLQVLSLGILYELCSLKADLHVVSLPQASPLSLNATNCCLLLL